MWRFLRFGSQEGCAESAGKLSIGHNVNRMAKVPGKHFRQNRVVTENLRSDIRVIAEGQTMLLGKLDSLIVSCGGRYASHESTLTSLKVRTSELESRMTRVEKFVRIDG